MVLSASCTPHPVGTWRGELACDDASPPTTVEAALGLQTRRLGDLEGQGELTGSRTHTNGNRYEFDMAFPVVEIVEHASGHWEMLIGDCVDASFEPGRDRFFCDVIWCEETEEGLSVDLWFVYLPWNLSVYGYEITCEGELVRE
ncbi:MAG: hypothetical protein H6739_18440 [Alphaproteobacteria bacterium]|nr:hypothetical protein [Alphaproteobacteria bacterium]